MGLGGGHGAWRGVPSGRVEGVACGSGNGFLRPFSGQSLPFKVFLAFPAFDFTLRIYALHLLNYALVG